jgi:hypothetical protein
VTPGNQHDTAIFSFYLPTCITTPAPANIRRCKSFPERMPDQTPL